MNVGSLFTGIGGWDLGLERAGMRVVWQCESDDFCRRVLAKHWPDVPCFQDVRDLSRAAGTPQVDVLCGGFPCQDFSYAGRGAGITGERSGLWSEYARLVGELEPRWVLVENVAALLGRGLGVVLADLAALGYDAEWDCLPASAIGAPHQRDRIWLVAYPHADTARRSVVSQHDRRSVELEGRASGRHADRLRDQMADAHRSGRNGRPRQLRTSGRRELADGGGQSAGAGTAHDWSVEPDVGRVAHGVPQRVDRVRALGNALVPQVAQWLGERIMSYEDGFRC